MHIAAPSRLRQADVTEIRLGQTIVLLLRPGCAWPEALALHRLDSRRVRVALHGFRQHLSAITLLRAFWHRYHLAGVPLTDEALLHAFAIAVDDRRIEALMLPRLHSPATSAPDLTAQEAGSSRGPVAASASVAPVQVAAATRTPVTVAQWDLRQRLAYVFPKAAEDVPGEALRAIILSFTTPEGIAAFALVIGLEVASHAAGGVGFFADAALVAVLWAMCGVSAFYAMIAFRDFLIDTIDARTDRDLDLAAQKLADAAVLLGTAALTFLGGWAKAKTVAGRIGGATGEAAGGGEAAASRSAGRIRAPNSSTPVGRRGAPMDVPRGTNAPAVIEGRSFSGHALDEMQSDGIPPSAVENTIRNGTEVPSSRPDTIKFHDPVNGISAVVNQQGTVVTVFRQSRIP